MKGILTNGITGKETEIELEYEIIKSEDGRRIFQLLNGVTGYEGFYIDHKPINPFIDAFQADIEKIKKNGWLACVGTKGCWDRLFISGEEMRKVLPER